MRSPLTKKIRKLKKRLVIKLVIWAINSYIQELANTINKTPREKHEMRDYLFGRLGLMQQLKSQIEGGDKKWRL